MAGNAYGEDEVYYCAETARNGFYFDEKLGSYQPTSITAEKFKIKLDLASKQIILMSETKIVLLKKQIFDCAIPWKNRPELKSCYQKGSFRHFNLNTMDGHFVLSNGYGHLDSTHGNDTISISYGTCDKF